MRLKKQQMEEERVHEIEKNNNILFRRIMNQKISHTEISDISKIKEYKENRNHIAASHEHFRKRGMEKILKENLTILQRIEEKAPNYNRLEWYSERCRNLGYLFNIAQYPKHYLDLLEEGKSNYDLVRPRTHHSTRLVALAERAAQVKTAPERMQRDQELRPKTRGEPISSPLPDEEETVFKSKTPSLKSITKSQQLPTHQSKGSVKGSTAALTELKKSRPKLADSGSKTSSKPHLGETLSQQRLADNRAIKAKEDEESAKAAIILTDDLADLGIVDCNSNGNEDNNEETSRPSSGWSEFADAASEENLTASDSIALESSKPVHDEHEENKAEDFIPADDTQEKSNWADEEQVTATDDILKDYQNEGTNNESQFDTEAKLEQTAEVNMDEDTHTTVNDSTEESRPSDGEISNQPLSSALEDEVQSPTEETEVEESASQEIDAKESTDGQEPALPNDPESAIDHSEVTDHSKGSESELTTDPTASAEQDRPAEPSEYTENTDVKELEETPETEQVTNEENADVSNDLNAEPEESLSPEQLQNSTEAEESLNREDLDHSIQPSEPIEPEGLATSDEPENLVDISESQPVENNKESVVTDENEKPEEIMAGANSSEVLENVTQTEKEGGEESEDPESQFKRPAPLPPIESSGQRPPSSSTSRHDLPLSRPISARVLGPIATPPQHTSKPPSRPISGIVRDSFATSSRKASLPALVKTLSSPSSRPLSGIKPLLSNPGSTQNVDDAYAVEFKRDGEYNDEFSTDIEGTEIVKEEKDHDVESGVSNDAEATEDVTAENGNAESGATEFVDLEESANVTSKARETETQDNTVVDNDENGINENNGTAPVEPGVQKEDTEKGDVEQLTSEADFEEEVSDVPAENETTDVIQAEESQPLETEPVEAEQAHESAFQEEGQEKEKNKADDSKLDTELNTNDSENPATSDDKDEEPLNVVGNQNSGEPDVIKSHASLMKEYFSKHQLEGTEVAKSLASLKHASKSNTTLKNSTANMDEAAEPSGQAELLESAEIESSTAIGKLESQSDLKSYEPDVVQELESSRKPSVTQTTSGRHSQTVSKQGSKGALDQDAPGSSLSQTPSKSKLNYSTTTSSPRVPTPPKAASSPRTGSQFGSRASLRKSGTSLADLVPLQ
ncbi:Ubiquitin-protein ligase [Rhizoclosmatium sp. JEL0117]|nr:Ubiquitin-protein ligase [Rhizoclosmatium sp. JEL0117]